MNKTPAPDNSKKKPNLFGLLKPYQGWVISLILLALLSNGLNLLIPKIIARGIDAFAQHNFSFSAIIIEFLLAAIGVFVFTYIQSLVQTYASERVAKDLRRDLSAKISAQSYSYIEQVTPAKLLTNLTSDIDSVKMFVSQAIVSIFSSVFIIIGVAILLISINWRLGLAVLLIVPIIGGTFFLVFGKVKVLFKKTREVIDALNKVINESILGSALIRVLNSQQPEYEKFISANTQAKNLGLQILSLFASLIPIITFVANLAALTILALGGHFVIMGTMSLGNFAAFNTYLALLIFPILIIGFMSNIIAQAASSYERVCEVLGTQEKSETGTLQTELSGHVEIKNLTLNYGEKSALKNVSLEIPPGTKTAIIGPTAAGKTQLLSVLTALIEPQSGTIKYDGHDIHEYEKNSFYRQVGLVFQDSIIFNLSLKENIAFESSVQAKDLELAITTAELTDFIEALPNKLETVVSERGSSLSGGQKQRIMLARALALNPHILYLDDFTARVDTNTEQKILSNISKNYPRLTLVSVTQKIAAIEHYDQIILLMEGEVIASGTHEELLKTCPEYVQIYNSQRSTSHYEELHA